VKPENLLLYSYDDKAVPCLKLADFGWAAVVGPSESPPEPPGEGVGSLWYAPPELNPPVAGLQVFADKLPLGKSDMWSVGVITYLLLTGHSPFNTAIRIQDPDARENEVLRLAALGAVNTSVKAWEILSEEARSFILALVHANPAERMSAREACCHQFMLMQDADPTRLQIAAPFPIEDSASRWQRLDGLQHLCWISVARASTEPELAEISLLRDFVRLDSTGSSTYIEQLAAKLVTVALPSWFHPQAAWFDMLYLAFLYLDVDCDGTLSVEDLSLHLEGESGAAKEVANAWIFKWRHGLQASLPVSTMNALSFADFHRVLCSAILDQEPCWDVATPDRMLHRRMEAIDEVCLRFLDEEFENYGVGI
ncbi:unnamed protein product, partial [Polarella glacialis]